VRVIALECQSYNLFATFFSTQDFTAWKLEFFFCPPPVTAKRAKFTQDFSLRLSGCVPLR
jgi:hypothetical protein